MLNRQVLSQHRHEHSCMIVIFSQGVIGIGIPISRVVSDKVINALLIMSETVGIDLRDRLNVGMFMLLDDRRDLTQLIHDMLVQFIHTLFEIAIGDL